MITIEPASIIPFQEFLNYNWIPNPNENTTEYFSGFGYNPNDAKDYNTIKESNPLIVWSLLKDGETDDDYHFYSGFFEKSDDVDCYVLTNEPAPSLNIQVALPV